MSLIKDWQGVLWYTPGAPSVDVTQHTVVAAVTGFCTIGLATQPSAITQTQLDWLLNNVMPNPQTLSKEVKRLAGYWAIIAGAYNSGAVKSEADFACDKSCRPHLDLFGNTMATLPPIVLGKIAACAKLQEVWEGLEPLVDLTCGSKDAIDAMIDDSPMSDQDARQILENVAQVLAVELTMVAAIGVLTGTTAAVTFGPVTVSASVLASIITGYFVAKDLLTVASVSMSCAVWKKTNCTCGDGIRQGPAAPSGITLTGTEGSEATSDTSGLEQCDGTDLGDQTCKKLGLGFTGGTLACKVTAKLDTLQHYTKCQLDTSGCSTCGNGTIDGTEKCEFDPGGAALVSGETCQTQGYPAGGTLGCKSDCSGYDYAGCNIAPNMQISGCIFASWPHAYLDVYHNGIKVMGAYCSYALSVRHCCGSGKFVGAPGDSIQVVARGGSWSLTDIVVNSKTVVSGQAGSGEVALYGTLPQ